MTEINPGALHDASLYFVRLIDAGQTDIVWNNGSSLVRNNVDRDDFVATIAKARAEAGALSTRTWRIIKRKHSKGEQLPPGEYAAVDFTVLAGGKSARETVTLRHDEDGIWRFVGYVIEV